MKKGWIDTHCHILSSDFNEDFELALQHCQENNVEHMLAICCILDECRKGLELDNPNMDLAVGFHPEDANNEVDYEELERLASHDKVIAVGEIGLDYYWVKDNKERQKEMFIRQIELANKLDKPIIVHSRDAMEDTIEILKNHPVNRKGIIHCFSGSVESAEILLKMGYYISLAGPVTYKKSVTPKEVAKAVPLDRLFTETDSPYLAPEPVRGHKNEPANVMYTSKFVASLREISEEDLMQACKENYERLFKISL